MEDKDREELDEVDETQEQASLEEWLQTLLQIDPMRRGRYIAIRECTPGYSPDIFLTRRVERALSADEAG